MNGRLEQEQKTNVKIEKIISKLPSYVRDWYYNLLASDVAPSSCYMYTNKVKQFFKYMTTINKTNIEQITQEDVDRYFVSLRTRGEGNNIQRTSDSFQLTNWFALRSFFDFLVNRHYINNNYVNQIHKPKNRDLERINRDRKLLTQEDFQKIMQAVEADWTDRDRNSLIFSLFMSTGMRLSALVAINNRDIDLRNRVLRVTDKGDKIHDYYISDSLKEYIEEYNHFKSRDRMFRQPKYYDEDPLFIDCKTGKRMTNKEIYKIVTKYTEKALGYPMSPHKLRAGFCSILFDKTHDAEFVRRAVGHSNLATTQRYIVTQGNEKQMAANIIGSILSGEPMKQEIMDEDTSDIYRLTGIHSINYYLSHPEEAQKVAEKEELRQRAEEDNMQDVHEFWYDLFDDNNCDDFNKEYQAEDFYDE